MMMLPGKRVSVQVPVAGRPFMTTLPVGRSQVGCVIAPGTGGVGIDGWVSKVTLCDGVELHPLALVTVKVYVPGGIPVRVVLVPEPR